MNPANPHDTPASSKADAFRFVSAMSLLVPDEIMSSGWLEHGAFAFWLIETLAPRTYVELGSHTGYSYFVVCQAVRKMNLPTTCYAVDTWAGDEHAGFYGESVYESVVALNEKYKGFSTLVRTTFDDAVRYFEDGSVDLLHIDGRHFYEDVKADFETWRPKLAANAVVLFHDINVRERDFGVWRFFDELKEHHRSFSFMHGNGLGVLAIDRVPDSLRDFFACDEARANGVRHIYSQLGAGLSEKWASIQHKRETVRLEGEFRDLMAAHEKLCAINADLEQRHREAHRTHLEVEQQHRDIQQRNAALAKKQRSLLARHATLRRNHDDQADAAARAQRTLRALSAGAVGQPHQAGLARLFGRKRPPATAPTQAEQDAAAGIAASGLFQVDYYLAHAPDIFLSGIEPALHFAQIGWKRGLRPNPFFDPLFYMTEYPEVARDGLNPLLHYAEHGWREGRRPSHEFDTTFYLARYPDVSATAANPLLHYIVSGRREGREAVPGGEPAEPSNEADVEGAPSSDDRFDV